MGIQERLKRQRYGEHNIIMPTKDDLLLSNIRTDSKIKHIFKKHNINQKVITTFTNPPVKDKYFKQYYKTIEDYNKYRDTEHSLTYITESILYYKLLYFFKHSNQYNNNFSIYSQSWIFGALCAMRKHIMYKKMKLNEIPILYDITSPSSNGYYPLPKPMGNKATILLAEQLYNILYPYIQSIGLKRLG